MNYLCKKGLEKGQSCYMRPLYDDDDDSDDNNNNNKNNKINNENLFLEKVKLWSLFHTSIVLSFSEKGFVCRQLLIFGCLLLMFDVDVDVSCCFSAALGSFSSLQNHGGGAGGSELRERRSYLPPAFSSSSLNMQSTPNIANLGRSRTIDSASSHDSDGPHSAESNGGVSFHLGDKYVQSHNASRFLRF